MGCCNLKRALIDDKIADLERSLALNQISINSFQKILKKKAGDRNISLTEFGEAFQEFAFGKAILSEQDTTLKRILSHQLFQGKENELDWSMIFLLGLLYCKGSLSEKIDAVLLTFDENHDGIIFTQTVKKIIRGTTTIAAAILPAVYHNYSFKTARQKTEDAVDDFVSDNVYKIFQSELKVDRARLKHCLKWECAYLLDSAYLRRQFPVKLGMQQNRH